jgi:hypothetical protein
MHMRKEKSYFAHEESKVIPCTGGEKVIPWHMKREKSYLAHVKRKVIPST